MAKVYITELARQGRDASGKRMVVGEEPGVANQTVNITASSVQSSAFNAATAFVRVSTDAICSIEIGTNPTATATTRRLPANSTEYFAVPIGQSYKLAAITNV